MPRQASPSFTAESQLHSTADPFVDASRLHACRDGEDLEAVFYNRATGETGLQLVKVVDSIDGSGSRYCLGNGLEPQPLVVVPNVPVTGSTELFTLVSNDFSIVSAYQHTTEYVPRSHSASSLGM